MTAFNLSSYVAMRMSDCSTSWREVMRPLAIAACISGIVASTIENGAGADRAWSPHTATYAATTNRTVMNFITKYYLISFPAITGPQASKLVSRRDRG